MAESDLAEKLRIIVAQIDKSHELSTAMADRLLILADKVEKNTEVKLSLRRLLTELSQDLDARERDWRHELVKVGQALAVISKDVDDVDKGVREASIRFATQKATPAEIDTDKLLGKGIRFLFTHWKWIAIGSAFVLSHLAAQIAQHWRH